jgi:hypothetical protein
LGEDVQPNVSTSGVEHLPHAPGDGQRDAVPGSRCDNDLDRPGLRGLPTLTGRDRERR